MTTEGGRFWEPKIERQYLERSASPTVRGVRAVAEGSDAVFELVGAPWIDSREFARYLNARYIDGVRFVPTKFTPASNRYAGQTCSGVNLVVINRRVLDGDLS